jgi:hypothetical protein
VAMKQTSRAASAIRLIVDLDWEERLMKFDIERVTGFVDSEK